MYRLPVLVSVLIFLSIKNTYGQAVDVVNKEVELTNYLTDNIKRQVKYLDVMHNLFILYQDNTRTSIRYRSNDGMRQPNSYTYDQLGANNAWAKSIWSIYNKLYDTHNQLIAYIKLEDFKSDNAQHGLQLISEMSSLTYQLSNQREILKELVFSKGSQWSGNEVAVYRKMLALVKHEEEVLNYLDESYLNDDVKTFQEEKIIKHYLISSELLEELEKYHQLSYPASSYFKSFLDAVRNLQKVKRKAVDENSYEHQKSLAYTNKVYDYFINYFNNDLLVFFDHFAEANGTKLYSYPKYIPKARYRRFTYLLKIDHNETDIKQITELDTQPIDHPMDLKIYETLNGFIEATNERTRQLKNLQGAIRNFQRSFAYVKTKDNEGQRNYNLFFKNEQFTIPSVDLAVLQKNAPKYIPKHSNQLIADFKILHEITLECERLCEELHEIAESKAYVQIGFKSTDDILDRLRELFAAYLLQKEKNYNNVRHIYEAYRETDTGNPWIVTSKVMLHAVDESKKVLHDVSCNFFSDSKPQINPEGLLSIRRDLVANEMKYMAGIKRLGRGNGHCPYTPYEYIPDKMKLLSDKLEQLDTYIDEQNYKKYEDYVYQYNDIVDNYNKFAVLGKGEIESARNDDNRPVFILHQTSTFAPFIREQSSKKENKNNAKQHKVANKVSKREPDQYNKEDKVTESQSIIRDTVYIEKVRTDTVYLHEDDVDFTSFDGYAHNNLVFLLDASGSMDLPDRLPLLKESINYLVSLMRAEDEISIIIYSGKANLVLKPTSAVESKKIKSIIDALKSDGLTNVNAGIRLAYKVADKNYKRGGNNRIILATDGEVQIAKSTRKLIRKFSNEDIYISVFTFGNKKSSTAESLAEEGQGNYKHITRQNINTELIKEAKAKRDN